MQEKSPIIITYGPSFQIENTPELLTFIRDAVKYGTSIIRFNLSHFSDINELKKHVKQIQMLSKKGQYNLKIMFDSQGPELRIINIKELLQINIGDVYSVSHSTKNIKDSNFLIINQKLEWKKIINNVVVLINDGFLKAQVIESHRDYLKIQFLNNGILPPSKKIIFEKYTYNLPLLSSFDLLALKLANDLKIDIFAISYVKDVNDINECRNRLNKNIEICSKIETHEAMKNLKLIIDNSDMVMCARGDLSLAIGFANLPIAQQKIANICLELNKPSIVATQLLESCCQHSYPLRSEVNDIAQAIRQQFTYFMLSSETSVSHNAINNIMMLKQIIDIIQQANLSVIK